MRIASSVSTLYRSLILSLLISSVTGRLSSSEQRTGSSNKNVAAHDDTTMGNMNGEYILSRTPNAPTDGSHKFPKRYADYPTKETKYVDVYSPEISTLYSQVYWKRMDSVQLPDEIINQFDNKVMAIVGWEVDQVIKGGDDGKNDISVPITVTYNHHYEVTVLGKDAKLTKVEAKEHQHGDNSGHGHPVDEDGYVWAVEDTVATKSSSSSSPSIPNSVEIGASNGGEMRKSYHGFAPGYAKLVSSPKEVSITPMQIDTWNRDVVKLDDIINKNAYHKKFVPGPLPRNSLAPKDADYSGLLECPVTTRITKVIEGLYDKKVSSACGSSAGEGGQKIIKTKEDCYAAVGNVTFGFNNIDKKTKWEQRFVNDETLPSGCSVMISSRKINDNDDNSKSRIERKVVVFNELKDSNVDCGATKKAAASFNTDTNEEEDISTGVIYTGQTVSLVDLELNLDPANNVVTIKIVGPSDVWFGVGFDARQMADEPWAITIDGHDGTVTERKLGDQGSGGTMSPLPPSLTVVRNEVNNNNKRTIVLARKMQGSDERYYTFDKDVTDLHFINAIGSTPEVSYHKDKTASMITILPKNGNPICICQNPSPPFGQAHGVITYEDGMSVGINNKCEPSPRSDLLDQRNPTCDIRTYSGGQHACHHMWSLLDADQEIPWKDQPLKYHLKFRIWYQEYDEQYHKPVYRTTWGIASPVEYDVPQCDPGTPVEKCIHTITGTFDVSKPPDQTMRLVSANFHCHAPTCLSIELYNNRTGELICREESIYGDGKESSSSDNRFNERGYIAIPPCVWGSDEYGLEEPPIVSGQRLYVVKTANSTYGHHGEMAWLQVLYTLEDDNKDNEKENVQVQ